MSCLPCLPLFRWDGSLATGDVQKQQKDKGAVQVSKSTQDDDSDLAPDSDTVDETHSISDLSPLVAAISFKHAFEVFPCRIRPPSVPRIGYDPDEKS